MLVDSGVYKSRRREKVFLRSLSVELNEVTVSKEGESLFLETVTLA